MKYVEWMKRREELLRLQYEHVSRLDADSVEAVQAERREHEKHAERDYTTSAGHIVRLCVHRATGATLHLSQNGYAVLTTGPWTAADLRVMLRAKELEEAWMAGMIDELPASGYDLALDSAMTLDVGGVVDARGIEYIGKAQRQPDGTWRCLANVQGALCIVEVNISVNNGAQP